MSWTIPLPERTRCLAAHNTHPGLLLDKCAASWNEHPGNEKFSEKVQRPTVDGVASLSKTKPHGLDYDGLLKRHQQSRPNATTFHGTTIGPLTMLLARASALENAGICLHPIYGFAYLPGSGLKGMAHAYACQVWLPAESARAKTDGHDIQQHVHDCWEQILRVFGYGDAPWFRELREKTRAAVQTATGDSIFLFDPTKERDEERQKRDLPTAAVGTVVFHDAWPTRWPKLIVDIVNCHHGDYYQPPDDRREYPPGDWENPVPVNFLAVDAGTQFEFAVSPRRLFCLTATPTACAPSLTDLANQWLAGALTHLGAGAKTAAGYGAFTIDSPPLAQPTLVDDVKETWDAVQQSKSRAEFSCTLELVTPAFLAGAKQEAEDCDLRPATLRGALRWWWRSLHAGHVDTATLRRMEAVVWGDTNQAGAVRLFAVRKTNSVVDQFSKAKYAPRWPEDKLQGDYGIPTERRRKKTTQGAAYFSYGMDEQRTRHVRMPGAIWNVTLTARAVGGLDTTVILEQAKAALFLATTYGGVGSKSRKGFGSLATQELTGYSPAMCEASASEFRRLFANENQVGSTTDPTSAFAARAGDWVVTFSWPDVWDVLDQVGFAYQSFAKKYAHKLRKSALGLPRRTRDDGSDRFTPSEPFGGLYEEAKRKNKLENLRFASPIHIHLDKTATGYAVRVTAFVQRTLPNATDSRKLLTECLDFLRDDLQRRADLEPPRRRPSPATAPNAPQPMARAATVSVPTVTVEDVAKKVAELTLPQLLFKIERAGGAGEYRGQFLRHAPNVAAKFQVDGGKTLIEAPNGLSDGTMVVAAREGLSNRAKFIEVFGTCGWALKWPRNRASPTNSMSPSCIGTTSTCSNASPGRSHTIARPRSSTRSRQ